MGDFARNKKTERKKETMKRRMGMLAVAGMMAAGAAGGEIGEERGCPVSGEVSVAWDSKFQSYGLIDGKNPIVTPAAGLTFFDLLTFDMAWLMDTTHYSRKLGIGNRQWQYFELDAGASLGHTFSPEDFSWLPTSVELGVGYMYEYHPRRAKCKTEGENGNPDTQFVTFEAGLPDLPLEPTFSYERDFMRDNGTYLALEVGHEFGLVDGGEGEDPEVGIDVRVAQGWGDRKRVGGYLTREDGEALRKAALMDTSVKVTLNWRPAGWLRVSPYVAFMDYLGSTLRDAAERYEPGNTGGQKRDSSWHFVGGVAVTAEF